METNLNNMNRHHNQDMSPLQRLLGRTMVVVAHPDDEAVGCGALLKRMRDPIVVFATDGAPFDKYFWGRYGSREAYRELRRKEARSALGLIGVKNVFFLGDDQAIVDQQLFRNLPKAVDLLSRLVGQVR